MILNHHSVTAENHINKLEFSTDRVKPEDPPYCECSFSNKSHDDSTPFLLWGFYESAVIRKNGNYIKLENLEENMGKNIGERGSFKFSNNEIVINGKCKVTKTCPANRDNCEIVYYEGEVEQMEGNRKTNFPVWGSCGC